MPYTMNVVLIVVSIRVACRFYKEKRTDGSLLSRCFKWDDICTRKEPLNETKPLLQKEKQN